MDPEKAIN
jgi:hypothetical protein